MVVSCIDDCLLVLLNPFLLHESFSFGICLILDACRRKKSSSLSDLSIAPSINWFDWNWNIEERNCEEPDVLTVGILIIISNALKWSALVWLQRRILNSIMTLLQVDISRSGSIRCCIVYFCDPNRELFLTLNRLNKIGKCYESNNTITC